MSRTPASKTQIRAMALLGMTPNSDYERAAAAISARLGYGVSEIPAGHSWRSVAKLSDADYLALLGTEAPAIEDIDRD